MELLGAAVSGLLAAAATAGVLRRLGRSRAAFVARAEAALRRLHPGEAITYVEERKVAYARPVTRTNRSEPAV